MMVITTVIIDEKIENPTISERPVYTAYDVKKNKIVKNIDGT